MSGICYAGVVLSIRTLRAENSAWLVALNHLFSASVLFIYVVYAGIWPSPLQLAVLAAFGFVQMGLPYLLFARGLQGVTSQEASLITLLEPVLVPVWAFLAWREQPAWWTLAGAGLILAGLIARYARRNLKRRGRVERQPCIYPSTSSRATSPNCTSLIEQYSFGLLISPCGDETQASHLPLLLDRTAGPRGELIGHMARANPQWQQADGSPVLAVFSGPHAYISPAWYEAENVVPTWNYTAVHVYGRFQAIHDPRGADGHRAVLCREVRAEQAPALELGRLGAVRRATAFCRSSASAFRSSGSRGSGSSARIIRASDARKSLPH